jgi:hypothetical protein
MCALGACICTLIVSNGRAHVQIIKYTQRTRSHTNTNAHTLAQTHAHTRKCKHTRGCTHVSTYIYTSALTQSQNMKKERKKDMNKEKIKDRKIHTRALARMHLSTYTHVHVLTYTDTRTDECMYALTRTRTGKHTHACMHVQIVCKG